MPRRSSLLVLLLSGPSSTLSERHPDPSPNCSNPDLTSPQDELSCREARAGGLQCRDVSKCRTDGFNCSDADVARRVGMTCSGWPAWNGGWPLTHLEWDSEDEYYECDTAVSPSNSSDYCHQWLTIEDGYGPLRS